MEFDHLSFWSPETGDEGADSRPFSGHTAPLFSPIQCEYGSFLEAFEMEFGAVAPSEPVVENRRENEEENEEGGLEEGNLGNAGCKNLLSERNRRRRLNQQLLALRSLVPCISKMDKRSILMDAAAYLQSLHQEIDQLKMELSAQEPPESSSTSSESIVQSPEEISPVQEASFNQHQIFELDTEELDDRTLSLKVAFKKCRGAPCQVQRMIESLGLTTTHAWTHETEGQRMITTCFIHMKRNSTLTAEMLKVQGTRAAVNFGFEIDFGD
ncbi:transcription factor bHLH35-like [Aristolochia californica]|uniref:transcription factor bHLH35-like n=1 Tax=Aristolochia californica TaxID=171875 RepID=UPI0035E351D6